VRCVRPSMPTRGQWYGRWPDDHRARGHTHRPVVAGGGSYGAPGPRPGYRARTAPRDPTAPSLRAGAEVQRHEHQQLQDRARGRGRRGRVRRARHPISLGGRGAWVIADLDLAVAGSAVLHVAPVSGCRHVLHPLRLERPGPVHVHGPRGMAEPGRRDHQGLGAR
jgi:hypothetical protein